MEDSNLYTWSLKKITVNEVVEKINSSELILRPEYQRRSVWPNSSKSSFIESLILNIPIPLFLIHLNENGQMEVVDGQQRLSSIYTYMKDGFKLTKLDKLSDLKGKFYSELSDSKKVKIREHILLFSIVDDVSENQIIDMYYRSNKFTVNLNPQEMRYAYYKDSDFKDLVVSIAEGEAEDDSLATFFLLSGILSELNINRMADLEYTSDLLALLHYKSIQDKKKVLDKIYEELIFIEEEKKLKFKTQLHETIGLIKSIFSSEVFKHGHNITAEKALSLTRFKQKNDFYSLFYVIAHLNEFNSDELHYLLTEKKDEFAIFLQIMDEYVAPEADLKLFSDYAIKCVSQANTKKSREYRSKFIFEGIIHILKINDRNIEAIKNNIHIEHPDIFLTQQLEEQINAIFEEFDFQDSINVEEMSFTQISKKLCGFYSNEE